MVMSITRWCALAESFIGGFAPLLLPALLHRAFCFGPGFTWFFCNLGRRMALVSAGIVLSESMSINSTRFMGAISEIEGR